MAKRILTEAEVLALVATMFDGLHPADLDEEQSAAVFGADFPKDVNKGAFKIAFDELVEAGPDPVEEDEHEGKHSVVSAKYKARYAERAAQGVRGSKGIPKKALKRSTNDWLAIELARRTLDEKAHLSVPAFEAILDANGVKHDHWNRTSPGWQGRLRMTGRLALQRVVAEAGELHLPEGETLVPPKSWVAKHVH